MPPSKGQSPVIFETGYDEGWAKCLSQCKDAYIAMLEAAPTPPADGPSQQCKSTEKRLAVQQDVYLGDLSTLVKQLVQALRKAAPNSDLPQIALDYLRRKGLQGSPLRSTQRDCIAMEKTNVPT